MAMFHCSIKIIGRSKGRSAIASAAYRSGERLYNEETGLIHDFTRKGGVVMSEIMLPENAPEDCSSYQAEVFFDCRDKIPPAEEVLTKTLEGLQNNFKEAINLMQISVEDTLKTVQNSRKELK